MINVNSSKLIIVVYMSPYLVLLLILEFLPVLLATLPNGLDSNVTQLLANLLNKLSVCYYLPIVSSNLVSIKLLLLLLLLLLLYSFLPVMRCRRIHCSSLPIMRRRRIHCSSLPIMRCRRIHCSSLPVMRCRRIH